MDYEANAYQPQHSPPSNTEARSISRLKSLWRRSGKGAGNAPINTDDSDAVSKRSTKPNSLSNLFTRHRPSTTSSNTTTTTTNDSHSHSHSPHSPPSEPPSSTRTPAQKRRQQVYQAQKRHRSKKASYTASLEAEIARLQHLDSAAGAERDAVEWQNGLMRRVLAGGEAGLGVRVAGVGGGDGGEGGGEEGMAWWSGREVVGVRWDAEVGHERTFVGSLVDGSGVGVGREVGEGRGRQHDPVHGDSAAALDFILALEWRCQDHTFHEHIHPPPEGADVAVCGGFEETGHALTATAAVYACALPAGNCEEGGGGNACNASNAVSKAVEGGSGEWELSHAEIEKLVALSTQLPIEIDRITPAQAYSAVKDAIPSDQYLRPALEALKAPLGSLVFCYGFGAALETEMFWQCFDGVIQTLEFTRPELVGSK